MNWETLRHRKSISQFFAKVSVAYESDTRPFLISADGCHPSSQQFHFTPTIRTPFVAISSKHDGITCFFWQRKILEDVTIKI